MTLFLSKLPTPARMLLGSLAFLLILIGFGLAYNWRPEGVQQIDTTRGDATLRFSADRAVTIWPFNCVTVDWSAEGISQIYLNDEPITGVGSAVLCGADRVVFRVVFPNNAVADYALGRDLLSRVYVIGALLLAIAIGPLMVMARRRRVPALAWILAGFGLAYILFFVIPTFMAVDSMAFPVYVPATQNIGQDLHTDLEFSHALLSGGDPYAPLTQLGTILNLYPPLQTIFFVPFAVIPERVAYWISTLLTIAAFCWFSLGLPRAANEGKRISPVILLMFLTGLMSYGFQFELERGQFNVIAMAMCFGAIALYHFQPKMRLLAYVLFVLSVQLKLYPLIFIVLLVEDWRDWKRNLKVLAGIGAANVALLFVLGPGALMDYVRTLTYRGENVRIWPGSGSITSFVGMLPEYGLLPAGASRFVALGLLVVFAACLGVIGWRAYKRNSGGIDAALLMACTIGAIILPGVSNDYKLPILVPAVAMILDGQAGRYEDDDRFWLTRHILLFVIALAYSSLLFSYVIRSGVFSLGLPASMTVLVAATILALLPGGESRQPEGAG